MSHQTSVLRGWGGLGAPGREVLSENLEAVTEDAVLTRGLGRAYGDAALPPEGVREVAGSRRADRILGFDEESGALRAEAGISLLELNRVLLPRGWFVPVSPGTQHVTLGGMVAADVHGKNHHRAGTLGRHVEDLRLRVADGRILRVSRDSHRELFLATLGGMGLTGHILEVTLAMEPAPTPWIYAVTQRFASLESLAEALLVRGDDWPFTAAWVDGIGSGSRAGRGVLLAGRWAVSDEAPPVPPRRRRGLRVPLDAPGMLLNRASMSAFNALYFQRHPKSLGETILSYEPFFYPLDAIGAWNRLYGRRGFTQYQCVVPREAGVSGLLRFWKRMRELGGRPYLVVLKDFGAEGDGVLSFPRPGFTLALDFPMENGIRELVRGLNAEVGELGGRVYLAKDALSTAEELRAFEGERLERFLEIKRRWDPEGRIRSRLAERLRLTGNAR